MKPPVDNTSAFPKSGRLKIGVWPRCAGTSGLPYMA